MGYKILEEEYIHCGACVLGKADKGLENTLSFVQQQAN